MTPRYSSSTSLILFAFHLILLKLSGLVINYFIPNTVHSYLLLSVHPNHLAKFQPWVNVNIHLPVCHEPAEHRRASPAPSRLPGHPRLRAFLPSVQAPIPHVLFHAFSKLIIVTTTLSGRPCLLSHREKRTDRPPPNRETYVPEFASSSPSSRGGPSPSQVLSVSLASSPPTKRTQKILKFLRTQFLRTTKIKIFICFFLALFSTFNLPHTYAHI